MSEENKKLIIRYYKLLKISLPCLVMTFLTGGIWLAFASFEAMMLGSSKSSGLYMPGFNVFIGLTILNLFMFGYSLLRVHFGLRGEKWQKMISELSNIDDVENHAKETAAAVGVMSAGRLMSKADNKIISNLGKGAQAAGAIGTVYVANEVTGSMEMQIREVAERCNIKLPSMNIWIVLIMLFPIIALGITFAPSYIESSKNKQEEIVRVMNAENQIASYLEPYFKSIQKDNPENRIESFYNITGRMENDKNEYMIVKITPEGNIKAITYHSYINKEETKEASIKSFNTFIKESTALLNSTINLTSITQVPDEASSQYLSKDEKMFKIGNIDNYKYTFSYYPKKYKQEPYFYFTIETQ